MALIILHHYGSRTAEKEGLAGVIDHLWNICENLATGAWSFADHLNCDMIKVHKVISWGSPYKVDLFGRAL